MKLVTADLSRYAQNIILLLVGKTELERLDMQLDQEGFLIDLSQWDEAVASQLAMTDKTCLNEAHWEVIYTLRQFYAETQVSPAMRPFVKLVRTQLGSNKGNSIYLMELFGSSPAKTAAKWAGLPRPTNCL